MIYHACNYTKPYFGNQHLNLLSKNIAIRWFGQRGMTWEHMESKIQRLVVQFGPPDVLMLHCGGNSIGTMSLRQLQRFMKQTMYTLYQLLPNCRFIWSEILPRTYYRHMFSLNSAEMSRKRINSAMSAFIIQRGGGYISYPDLKSCSPVLFRDGVHLTDIGQTIFLNTIQGGLFTIIREGVQHFPPRAVN